jgi:predicted Ser/Thr protein kinase
MMQLDAGSQLGSYRIEGYIGRGGMGVVYRAEHAHLGRQVALKLLAPELAENQSFRERFVRESRVAARVDHPNVIPIYEAGEADGHYFIAMRFVDGLDLREILHSTGPLDLTRALSVLTQVAGALDAAHAQGLVHRDVKPGNILVVPDSEHCYLTDFGLTKAISSDTAFTATGQFVGTTDYVAPEQIEGKELDRRTDVYSLGCVFYECLAGMTPFRRDSDMAVMWAHMQEPPPRVTERRPDLPAGLNAVISTAMAKSKDDRYPSCSTFAAAARSAIELATGQSAVAMPTPPAPVAPAAQVPPAAPAAPVAPVASGAHTSPGEAFAPAAPAPAGPYYAAQPYGGYAQPGAPGGSPRRQKPLTAIALVIGALLLAGGGTAAALIIAGQEKDKTVAAAPAAQQVKTVTAKAKPTPRPTKPSKTVAPTPQAPPEPPSTPTPTPTPPSSGGSVGAQAENIVHDYWKTLAAGDLSGAYEYLDPSTRDSRDHWLGLRRGDGLYYAGFHGIRTTSSTSSDAYVSVDLITKQTSCHDQEWVGTYHVVRVGSEWLIHNHEFPNPPSC